MKPTEKSVYGFAGRRASKKAAFGGLWLMSGGVRMNKYGMHLSGVGCWVEQLGFTTSASVCTEESFAFGPSATPYKPLFVDGFGGKIAAICDELCVGLQLEVAKRGCQHPWRSGE